MYLDGPILAAVSSAQITGAIGAILLMAVAVAVIVGGTQTRVRRLEPDALVLLVVYAAALAAVWVAGS